MSEHEDMTPLHAAAEYYSEHPELSDTPMLKLMLESRTDDARHALAMTLDSDDGRSVLVHATGSTAAIAYLLTSGVLDQRTVRALLRTRSESGTTLADYACMEHDLGSLKLLCEAGFRLR